MSKTATIRARVEPSLKDRVEKIFEKLGENFTYLISIRNDYDNFETLSLVLTELSDVFITKVNPNSGNQITSWLL